MINLFIIQGCQSGSVGRVGQLVSWSGWSDWSDGLGGPGGPGGPGWVLKGPKSAWFIGLRKLRRKLILFNLTSKFH